MNDVQNHEPADFLERVVTRLVTPIGCVLVLLILLFVPCVTASTRSADPRLKRIFDESFTGWNIATDADLFSVAVRILTVTLFVALVVGAGTALVRNPRKRSLAAAVTTAVSGGLLVATGLWASHWRDAKRDEFMSILTSTLPPVERAKFFDQIGSEVGVGLGFWLGLAGLGVIIAFNVYLVLRGRRRPADAVR
ncbi:hypothetical protein [Actinomadura sp. 9N215]|uniref:hypothetical protein n=1 Tax=Actinomadura sp. 9N215 TaxID=3375150 RepID=UPI0037975A33